MTSQASSRGFATTARRPIAFSVVMLVLLVCTMVPVLLLIVRALAESWRYPTVWPDLLSGRAFTALAEPGRLRAALVTSVTLAVATGFGATLIGYVVARALSRTSGALRQVGSMAAFFPVVAPPVALGTGLQVAALAAGVGSEWTGVWLSHLVPACGYVTLYFVGVLSSYDSGIEEAARSLGASRAQVFRRITAPALRQRFLDALWLGALVSWGQLALTLIVGGGAVRTLPVELLAVLRAGDDRVGAASALVLAALPIGALVATRIRWRSIGSPP